MILQTAKLCTDRLTEIAEEKRELIKGSLYVHQVLSLAFYPIRYEAFLNRYRLLKIYMTQVHSLFPDIWANSEVKEFQTWEGAAMQIYRKISCFLLQHRQYLLTAAFWELCRWVARLKRFSAS